ncbi:MAG TPA: folylpolyglutamate synthase/dihydrofolate synthase family protein [Solirubrobacteraceae bacterium]|nr:folylpolyglutamate synthase/dihydrofolate synthase family protein [Solirubrobacteraceae bacterium]
MTESQAAPTPAWSSDEAEAFLLRRERFGMRFGLDRIRRLLNVLELGELPFPTIHIVGTNGKSSTTRMIAALLERHGLRTGCFTSPHLLSYRERVRVAERDIAPARFAAAVERTVRAADLVDRSQSDPQDRVTQFELLTALALSEFTREGVDVAVLEAGLGGRYDATNAIGSPVVVLTNVGLEHTRYLGPTVAHIAREKLAVVRDGATLVVGPDLDPVALDLAEQTAAERGARLTRVRADAAAGAELRARGAYQRVNFAVACEAARAFLGRDLEPAAVRGAAADVRVPGRFEVRAGRPTVLLDGAHNAGGIDALCRSLPEFLDGRRLVSVVSILDDKDAASMLARLLEHSAELVCTACASPRALPPATLASLAEQLGAGAVTVEADPRTALARAAERAGEDGAVLATGSIYLLADLLRDPDSHLVSTL